jgi:hypothetical protein
MENLAYDQVMSALIGLVNDDQLRCAAEENGFRIFSRRTQAD